MVLQNTHVTYTPQCISHTHARAHTMHMQTREHVHTRVHTHAHKHAHMHAHAGMHTRTWAHTLLYILFTLTIPTAPGTQASQCPLLETPPPVPPPRPTLSSHSHFSCPWDSTDLASVGLQDDLLSLSRPPCCTGQDRGPQMDPGLAGTLPESAHNSLWAPFIRMQPRSLLTSWRCTLWVL